MRITGPNRPAAPQAGAAARRAEGGGATFAPTEAAPTARAATPAAAGPITTLDALIALQAVDADRPQRRRRAVKRGHDLLDGLDEVRIGLLSGTLSPVALDRILALVSTLEPSGDEAVDALVAEIALRAEVEAAKLGRFRDGG